MQTYNNGNLLIRDHHRGYQTLARVHRLASVMIVPGHSLALRSTVSFSLEEWDGSIPTIFGVEHMGAPFCRGQI